MADSVPAKAGDAVRGGADAFASARDVLGRGGMLSVVMPAYRLAATIADNVRRVRDLIGGQIPFEIVVVDDGSGDGTAEAIRSVEAESPATVHAVLLMENCGKGGALRRGFEVSRGSHVMLLDADLDLAPEKIPAFFDVMLRDGADIVIGSKRHPDSEIDYPPLRRLASFVYYTIVRILVGLPVTDTQTGMKLFRREALAWSLDRMLVRRFAFDLEMLAIAREHGCKVSEAPIKMEFGDKMGSLNFAAVKSVMTDTLSIFYRLRVIRYYSHVRLVSLSDPPPRVSVVIACPRPSSYLDEALEGLAAQTFSPFEVIVLPDDPIPAGSTIFSAHLGLAQFWESGRVALHVIPTGRVRPAEKRNIGIAAATGDIVAFLDDDASPQPQWLAQACRHFTMEDVGAVGGPAVTPPNDPTMAHLGGDVYASPIVSGGARFRYYPERIRDVDDIPSCNLLVRASILREIGGFNTRYWPGEDTILCLEIAKRGLRQVYDPFAMVHHHRRPLFLPHLRQVGRYAMHRGFFCRVFPQTSLRFSYFVPSLFVVGLVAGAAASAAWPALRPFYLGAVAVYLAVTFTFAFKKRPSDWLILWSGIMLTHIWYGIRFIQGIVFGRMPSEVRSFDHGGESAATSASENQ